MKPVLPVSIFAIPISPNLEKNRYGILTGEVRKSGANPNDAQKRAGQSEGRDRGGAFAFDQNNRSGGGPGPGLPGGVGRRARRRQTVRRLQRGRPERLRLPRGEPDRRARFGVRRRRRDLGFQLEPVLRRTSNLDFKPFGDAHTNEEIDLYGGWRPTADGVSLDLGAQYYGYVNQPTGGRVAYTEVYAKATHAIGAATLGASVYYSPQFTGHTGEAWYTEANLAYTLSKTVSASGALGRQSIEAGGSYTTWNAGLTWTLNPHLSLDARYWDTDEHQFGTPYHARVVAALKATF
jgi:hypothetical protein